MFFILFNTVSYIKLNFKQKIDLKLCTFKNLEEVWKIRKKKEIMTGSPVFTTRLLQLDKHALSAIST